MWKFGNLEISTSPHFPISKCSPPSREASQRVSTTASSRGRLTLDRTPAGAIPFPASALYTGGGRRGPTQACGGASARSDPSAHPPLQNLQYLRVREAEGVSASSELHES